MYSGHFSLESQREHAEEVARCSSEVFLGNCHVCSGADNEATRRSYFAPEVVCQTEWRENYTRALQNSGNMSIFNHSMFRFCVIYLLPRRKRIESFHFQPLFPQDLSFPAFSIYGQSLEYELITGDHRTNQIA